jgi:hypothetical protein
MCMEPGTRKTHLSSITGDVEFWVQLIPKLPEHSHRCSETEGNEGKKLKDDCRLGFIRTDTNVNFVVLHDQDPERIRFTQFGVVRGYLRILAKETRGLRRPSGQRDRVTMRNETRQRLTIDEVCHS